MPTIVDTIRHHQKHPPMTSQHPILIGILSSVLISLLTCASALAQSDEILECGADVCNHDHGPSWLIQPFLNIQSVAGHSGLEHSGLEQGAHDPQFSGFNLTGLSIGADFLYSEHLAGYAEGIITWNGTDGWDAELEEVNIQFLNLPGDLDIKVGRLFAAVGTQNTLHNHAWHFVDTHLSNVRFFGADGLILDGAEVQWTLPTSWNHRIILSYGNTVSHDHSDDQEHQDDHGHGGDEAEMTAWDGGVFTARYEASFWPGDTCQFVYGASYVQGKNHFNQWSRLYGMDLAYTWLQNEELGKKVSWINDVMIRDVGTDEGSFHELALNSTVLWKFALNWEAGLRYGYLEGVDDPEFLERHRISPALTRYFAMNKTNAMVRLQYNYDHSEYRNDDHSIWLQFGFEWGAGGSHVH